ncbi:MAG: hypothetical protein ACKO0Z_25840 [Betaproteobacteria bacterium]
MKQREAIEGAILIAITAGLYWLGYELQGLLFQFTEHIPGVNWFYLPAGLRVLFVLVAGIYGAVGIFAATVVIDLMHMQDLSGALLLLTAAASGFGAWVALWVLRWRGLIAPGLQGLTVAGLLQFACVYATFNALFHQVTWWAFKREGSLLTVDIWPMFVGDLLGALAFLYLWKFAMMAKRSAGLPRAQ